MPDHSFSVYPFTAYDGFGCNLWRLNNSAATPKGPVLLVHGAGVCSNLFNPPNARNLIDMLAEAGYDVWLENWRGSIQCPPNQWDLDVVAENDHPAAVAEVCRQTGASQIKAIIHCQGSTSFMISAIRGLVPQVAVILSNAVSLHPIVPSFSRFKLTYLLPAVKAVTAYLNPHWAVHAPGLTPKAIRAMVMATHWEADTPVGKMVSFTYGAGHPALWELENLSAETKQWICEEFGAVPISFFNHIGKCVKAGALVSRNGAIHYARMSPRTKARFVFFAGKKNKCFLSESQVKTYHYFNGIRKDYHKLYTFDKYSHLDIFFGRHSDTEIFPTMIRELNG